MTDYLLKDLPPEFPEFNTERPKARPVNMSEKNKRRKYKARHESPDKPPTAVQLTLQQSELVWKREHNLQLLQDFMLKLNMDDPREKYLFLRAMDVHAKIAGYYSHGGASRADGDKPDQQIIYIAHSDNDKAWEDKVAKQQSQLPMPTLKSTANISE